MVDCRCLWVYGREPVLLKKLRGFEPSTGLLEKFLDILRRSHVSKPQGSADEECMLLSVGQRLENDMNHRIGRCSVAEYTHHEYTSQQAYRLRLDSDLPFVGCAFVTSFGCQYYYLAKC